MKVRNIPPTIAALLLVLTLLVATPAHSAPSHNTGLVQSELGAKGSWQRIQWHQSQRRVHLGVKTGAKMSTKRCLEASFDWRVPAGGGHYDQRTVRNCKPGSYVSTDPGGDAYWDEPDDWDGRKVNGVFAAGALIIKNTSLEIVDEKVLFGPREHVYGRGTDFEPVATEGQYLVAMRTMYESGRIVSTRIATKPESCINKSTKRCKGRG